MGALTCLLLWKAVGSTGPMSDVGPVPFRFDKKKLSTGHYIARSLFSFWTQLWHPNAAGCMNYLPFFYIPFILMAQAGQNLYTSYCKKPNQTRHNHPTQWIKVYKQKGVQGAQRGGGGWDRTLEGDNVIKLNRKRRTEEEEEEEEEAAAGSTRSLVPAGLRDLTAKKVQQSSRLERLRLSRAPESNLCSLVLASPPTLAVICTPLIVWAVF